jgi:hypothetical protein
MKPQMVQKMEQLQPQKQCERFLCLNVSKRADLIGTVQIRYHCLFNREVDALEINRNL